jgi:hypothetical protein
LNEADYRNTSVAVEDGKAGTSGIALFQVAAAAELTRSTTSV